MPGRLILSLALALLVTIGTAAQPRHSVTRITIVGVFPEAMRPVRIRTRPAGIFVLSGRRLRIDKSGGQERSVLLYDRSLKLTKRVVNLGNGAEQIDRPTDFDVASDGTLWIADQDKNRLGTFDQSGKLLRWIAADSPMRVVALSDGRVAAVGAFAKPLFTVYTSDGRVVGEAAGLTAVGGATERQQYYFNRPAIAALQDGNVAAVPIFVLSPSLKIYAPSGDGLASVPLPLDGLAELLREATEEQQRQIATHGLGGRHVVNDIAVHPNTGDVWIALGAPGLLRYSRSSKTFVRMDLVGVDRTEGYGLQTIELGDRELFGTIGQISVKGTW